MKKNSIKVKLQSQMTKTMDMKKHDKSMTTIQKYIKFIRLYKSHKIDANNCEKNRHISYFFRFLSLLFSVFPLFWSSTNQIINKDMNNECNSEIIFRWFILLCTNFTRKDCLLKQVGSLRNRFKIIDLSVGLEKQTKT